MQQVKISLSQAQKNFLDSYQEYGFKNKSSLVRKALETLRKELERQSLKDSADLYAEVYERDRDLQEMTDSAVSEWPE